MKSLILVFSILYFATVVGAEIYVVKNKATNEVVSISPENDAVVQEGEELVVLEGKFKDNQLLHDAIFYKLSGKKFVLNSKKLDDEQKKQAAEEEAIDELNMVDRKARLMACEALKSDGVTLKHIQCSDFDK